MTSSSSGLSSLPTALTAATFSCCSVADYASFTCTSRSIAAITRHPTWAAFASPSFVALPASCLLEMLDARASGNCSSSKSSSSDGKEEKKEEKQTTEPELKQQQPVSVAYSALLRMRPRSLDARALAKHNSIS
jgi:hypothetical protein